MKRFISRAGLIAGLFFSFSLQAQAISLGPAVQMGVLVSATEAKTDKALEAEAISLSAGMTQVEFDDLYLPLRQQAKHADADKRLADAADYWVRAAYQHRVPTYRAAALRNAAFFSARITECDRARDLWNKSLALLKLIEDNPDKFPATDKKETSRKKTLADIRWGLDDSACRVR